MNWDAVLAKIEATIVRTDRGCWEWTGSLDRNGYARMTFRKKNCVVSRIAWCAFHKAEWPAQLYALHSCDNPQCVNPSHIRPGTSAENAQESVQRGRHPMANKTHCPKGHEYTPENTAISTYGGRVCRACQKAHKQAAWQRLKEKNRRERDPYYGEHHPNAKITEQFVRDLRAGRVEGTNLDIAQTFGVSKSTIRDARNGKSWKHVA